MHRTHLNERANLPGVLDDLLADHAAAAVISGDFGPKAQRALDAAGIAMYRFESCVTAREALERFKARELPAAGAGLRLEDGEG